MHRDQLSGPSGCTLLNICNCRVSGQTCWKRCDLSLLFVLALFYFFPYHVRLHAYAMLCAPGCRCVGCTSQNKGRHHLVQRQRNAKWQDQQFAIVAVERQADSWRLPRQCQYRRESDPCLTPGTPILTLVVLPPGLLPGSFGSLREFGSPRRRSERRLLHFRVDVPCVLRFVSDRVRGIGGCARIADSRRISSSANRTVFSAYGR